MARSRAAGWLSNGSCAVIRFTRADTIPYPEQGKTIMLANTHPIIYALIQLIWAAPGGKPAAAGCHG